jgi:hypothetical protein
MAHTTEHDTTPRSERMATERAPLPEIADAVRPAWVPITGLVLLTIVAIAAGIAAGARYAIPVGILAALGWLFYASHRFLAGRRPSRGDDSDSAIPHMGFDDDTPLGDTQQHPDSHAQPRSTGAR